MVDAIIDSRKKKINENVTADVEWISPLPHHAPCPHLPTCRTSLPCPSHSHCDKQSTLRTLLSPHDFSVCFLCIWYLDDLEVKKIWLGKLSEESLQSFPCASNLVFQLIKNINHLNASHVQKQEWDKKKISLTKKILINLERNEIDESRNNES